MRTLSLSPESLSRTLWTPRKDYERNRLISGSLQLADGTVLLIDQTRLREGKIRGVAVTNLQALRELTINQTLPIDFKFYKTTIPLDIPIVTVAPVNSLIEGFCAVRLQMNATPTKRCVDAKFVRACREFVECARSGPYGVIANDISPSLQRGFATARAKGLKVEQSDAHRWLTMASLIAKAHLSADVKPEHVERAVTLDLGRRARTPETRT